MRERSNKGGHKGVRKFIFLGSTVLIFSIYLIFSYNNTKDRSYIYEPVFIRLQGKIPEKTSLKLSYQTFNDPTRVQEASLITADSIPEDVYIFKIDSTFRLRNFSIYFKNLWEDEEILVSSIKASNTDKMEFSFSLENKNLIPSKNLSTDQLDHGALRIKRIPYDEPTSSSLRFYTRNLNDHVLIRTNVRDPAFPSLLAMLGILALGTCLFFCLYPPFNRLNWNGISLGAYLLALAILIMPTGEKTINLLLTLALLAGFIQRFRDGTFRNWLNDNRVLLLVSMSLIILYLIAFLYDGNDPSTQKFLKIKYGLPMILLAVAVNTNYKRDIRLQYAALLSGVIISVFMHFGWAIMLIDAAELKNKLFSNPQYYLESSVFSRIHHSYLSILYLASLATMYLIRDIIELHRKEIIVFSLLLFAGLFFAFSRAAILSLILILIFFSLKLFFHQLEMEISRVGRFSAAFIISLGILILVFADLRIYPATDNVAVEGLSNRMDIWGNAGDLIREKPIAGRGPGNYKYALIEKNVSAAFNTNRWRVLNTHNQFLETAGMFGLPLALSLAWFLLFPTGFSRLTVRFSDFILTAAIIFGTAFFFESLLNRNLGVLIFGLFYGFLIKMKTIYGR